MKELSIGEAQMISQIGSGAIMDAQEQTGARLQNCSVATRGRVSELIQKEKQAAEWAIQCGPAAFEAWQQEHTERGLTAQIAEILQEEQHG